MLSDSSRKCHSTNGIADALYWLERTVMNGSTEIVGTTKTTSTTAVRTTGREMTSSVRIWMVDDNSTFRSLLANLLNEEDGIHCERQFSSPAGILDALTEENAPDVILLDIQMGEYNGLDAIAPIKLLAKKTHVLMLTTLAGPSARERAFREGASDFLLKSWSLAEIVTHIRQVMEFGPVAGLLTAYLTKAAPAVEKTVKTSVAAPAKFVRKSNGFERWVANLRGLFSPSAWKLAR